MAHGRPIAGLPHSEFILKINNAVDSANAEEILVRQAGASARAPEAAPSLGRVAPMAAGAVGSGGPEGRGVARQDVTAGPVWGRCGRATS